jgi:hypothetical protein
MLEISGNTNRLSTECGHEFHTKCLLSNVAYNGFGCPYCRSEMVEESVSNHMHEDEDDDDEEDYEDENEGDENNDVENNQLNESDVLRGFRFMLERVTGEVLTNEDDVVEENEYQNKLDNSETPRPSVALISKKLSDQGITIETMVKALLLDHSEYNDASEEEFYQINDDLFDKIRDIIENYKIEQEEDLVENDASLSLEFLVQELVFVPPQVQEPPEPEPEQDYNFYFLENDFIQNCKQNTFLLDEEPNFNNYLIEEQFINSIVHAVF